VLLKVNYILVFLLFAMSVQAQPSGPAATQTSGIDTLWKHDRNYDYMQYMDSLLRHYNHIADSVSRFRVKGKVSSQEDEPSFLARLLNFRGFKILFYLIIAAFVVFVLHRLYKYNIFTRNLTDDAPTEDIRPGVLDIPDFYNEHILKSEEQEAFHEAIRYLFVQTLSKMSEKELILFQPEKTNYEYSCEINDQKVRQDFDHLARIYEYAWYGHGVINKENYRKVKEEFKNFNQKL